MGLGRSLSRTGGGQNALPICDLRVRLGGGYFDLDLFWCPRRWDIGDANVDQFPSGHASWDHGRGADFRDCDNDSDVGLDHSWVEAARARAFAEDRSAARISRRRIWWRLRYFSTCDSSKDWGRTDNSCIGVWPN